MDYKASGVDIDAGNETVRRIKSLARSTFTPGVLSEIGSFGGLFGLDRERFQEPVLVSSASGVARGCRENGCALIGGETAEMPGFYADGEYDIAGFIVGVVEKSHVIDGRTIVPGDVLIALPSAGLHTNGYSLARRVFFDVAGWKPDTLVPELETTIGH